MIRVGVVGYGYWGPNLVRNFWENPNCKMVGVCDKSSKRLALAKRNYPSLRVTEHAEELILSPDIDVIAIATPVNSHLALGQMALEAGKHVLIEKPLASSSSEAELLIEEAAKRNLVLMVDHTFLYTGAVRKIKQLAESGELGVTCYYDSVRVNLGLFQPDVNVIWDLAVHDLSIMDYLLPGEPCAVSATGMSHLHGCKQSIGYLTCFFSDSLIAHVHVNWLSPVKIRRTLLGCNRKMVLYDDVEPSEKVKIYDKGVSVAAGPESIYHQLIQYRLGDMHSPRLDSREALSVEIEEFVQCIETSTVPISDGIAGLRVVRLLEAATESMAHRGAPVELGSRDLKNDSVRRLTVAVSGD